MNAFGRRAMGLAIGLATVVAAAVGGGAGARADAAVTWSNGCAWQWNGAAWTEAQCPLAGQAGWWEDDVYVDGQWVLNYYVLHYSDGGYLVQTANGNQILVHPDGNVEYFVVDPSFSLDADEWMGRMENPVLTDQSTWIKNTSGWSTVNIDAIFGGYLNQRWMALTCTTPNVTCFP